MKAPFPYFGGKAIVALKVWAALGCPAHYIEPFFGSGAVLLARPDWVPSMTETINDKDGFIANIWRALRDDPDEVARWCDWPVNHADLIARKARLIKEENYLLENLCRDDKWYDAELAGYWIWAASCWIGSGLTRPGQIPHISDAGKGVHAKGQIPHIINTGRGVHALHNTNTYAWFRRLSERLRYVRVVCGDWMRVCGGNWQSKRGGCGMFFDPPYSADDRNTAVYHVDSTAVARDVEKWCLGRGADNKYKIVVAGYSNEYQSLVENGWTTERWKTQGGYSSTSSAHTRGKENRHRETLFYSPHCRVRQKQRELF